MSKFSQFMKANKIIKVNERHCVTKSLCDNNGQPLEWEFRHITSAENERIKDDCMVDVPIDGQPNAYRPKFKTNLYNQKLIAASVVYPDLYDAELQDSYDVKTPEELLLALVDDPGEFNDLVLYVQKFQGFNISFNDKVNTAKN